MLDLIRKLSKEKTIEEVIGWSGSEAFYDEGVWTPEYAGTNQNLRNLSDGTLTDGDISWGAARWARIGNFVNATIDEVTGFQVQTGGAGTANFMDINMNGLPGIDNTTRFIGNVQVSQNPLDRPFTQIVFSPTTSNQVCRLYWSTDGGLGGGDDLRFNSVEIRYFTNY